MMQQTEPVQTNAREQAIQRIKGNRAAFLASMTEPNEMSCKSMNELPTALECTAEKNTNKRAISFITLLSWGLFEAKLNQRMQDKPISTLGMAFVAGFSYVALALKPKTES
jgi:hypothetical protein